MHNTIFRLFVSVDWTQHFQFLANYSWACEAAASKLAFNWRDELLLKHTHSQQKFDEACANILSIFVPERIVESLALSYVCLMQFRFRVECWWFLSANFCWRNEIFIKFSRKQMTTKFSMMPHRQRHVRWMQFRFRVELRWFPIAISAEQTIFLLNIHESKWRRCFWWWLMKHCFARPCYHELSNGLH